MTSDAKANPHTAAAVSNKNDLRNIPCQLNVGAAEWEVWRGIGHRVIDLYRYRHLLVAAYVVVLLAATLAPVPHVGSAPSGFDKLVHVGLFGGLAFLVCWFESEPTWAGTVRALAWAAGAALMIEVLQGALPFRNADLIDFVAGLLGAVLGVAAASVLRAGRQSSPGR